MFELDQRLENDTLLVGDFDLCRVLLMNDAAYPWIILVPRLPQITEIFELTDQQQLQLMQESNFVLQAMNRHFQADKMNVAALGNVVAQLHVHHIARFTDDQAWPAPVWGKFAAQAYESQPAELLLQQLRELLVDRLI